MLEELLDDVVAEDVGHEGVRGALDLREDHRLVRKIGALKLLLDEPRAVLVLRKLDDVAADVSKGHVRKPVVPAQAEERHFTQGTLLERQILVSMNIAIFQGPPPLNVNCNKAFPA